MVFTDKFGGGVCLSSAAVTELDDCAGYKAQKVFVAVWKFREAAGPDDQIIRRDLYGVGSAIVCRWHMIQSSWRPNSDGECERSGVRIQSFRPGRRSSPRCRGAEAELPLAE